MQKSLLNSPILFLPVLLFFSACSPNAHEASLPNIVLIVTDDQGWGDLGINGNTVVRTPNIDKLAKEGAQFNRFYVSPVCSPTRAEILTGRYHVRSGVYSTSQGGERLDLDETTIAEVLKDQGYNTAAYGKWHNGSQPPYHPNNRGFDEYYGFCSGHWGNYFSPMLERNGEVVQGNGFIIDDLTNNALKYIEAHRDQPFFTYLAYNTPHSPMQVPDKWWDNYSDATIDSTHRYAEKENMDKTRAALALCENIDWNVGRIVTQLEHLDLLENTIIIYMSDNGPNGWRWNDGLKGIKGHTDEGGVRSPFIVNWKGTLQAQEIDEVAGSIDILPSLVDMANVEFEADLDLDGKSLKPLLFGENNTWDDRYIFSHWRGNISVRNKNYILDQNDQLYNLNTDPGQSSPIQNDTIIERFLESKNRWIATVLKELDPKRKEVFPVGFEGSRYTHLPARDGVAHGNILRSNRWPNSSYFTNWISTSDSITWDCDILTSGNFKASIYYTCKPEAIGSEISLSQGGNSVSAAIKEAHDPPFEGVEYDRVERDEGYEKNFKKLELGTLELNQGLDVLKLRATKINGSKFIDFRLLVLEKI